MIDICNMLQTKGKTKILFVCLGNICRSSSAEGVMKQLIEQAGREDEFIIDSAGILSYHQGELHDSRMRAHAARRGYDLTHRSRQTFFAAGGFTEYFIKVTYQFYRIAGLKVSSRFSANITPWRALRA